jgi:hypothetical protein
MPDVLVTLPQSFGLTTWMAEGDAPGEPWSGEEWHFYLGGPRPRMAPGERVYVCYKGHLLGYAPLVRMESAGRGYALVRHGGAQAVTIPDRIPGFRGFRYRFWPREEEVAFPNWRTLCP